MDNKRKQLLIAILIAGGALFLNNWYIQERIAQVTPKRAIKVVRAKSAIPSGERLSSKHVETVQVPENYKPKVAISDAEISQYFGQELAVDVLPGDYILQSYFTLRRAVGNKLSDLVTGQNFRAVTIPVDQTSSLSGSIVSGDRIDILLTFGVPGLSGKFSTALLQNVQVIATGSYSVVEQETGATVTRTQRYNSLTLLLTAPDAARLTYARQTGKIDILLRNSGNDAIQEIPAISNVLDLLSAEEREKFARLIAESRIQRPNPEDLKNSMRELMESQKRQGLSVPKS
ncbi:Flp pilus assembly protein CpaB [bacterium]|nr:Flp pilus assembly protein CpaB [bacterium]